MKKIFLSILTLGILSSCSSEYENYLEDAKNCMEEKVNQSDLKYSKINDALTAYDFETARLLLSCYRNENYANDRLQNPQCSGCINPYKDNLKKIVEFEVTYYLSQDDYIKAMNSANESSLNSVFNDKLPGAVNNWISQGKIETALKTLSLYTPNPYDPNDDSYSNGTFAGDRATSYNKEINTYNDMIMSIINNCIFEKDIENIKKAFFLIKPNSIKKDKKYILKNSKKPEIKKILTQNKIYV
tara:strand:- start:1882 stop:2610 length:729 start_codon:yes stop_codon:yes gene_type:complete